ncbi:MAG TPA: malto-oligosyltrehalose synthase [Baekduia sp.]|uniref:malto-oligosyltrehalose synthase n=1 Tax=Baekduia sp. TaxID=2600305 RepID=UPI002D76A1DA|nr:malto-oligosyltrehalose synthase [Baekduia sp.]HET6506536.1 malto-oligosyltrehalose synthase [Baekduia sp.]
MSGARRAPLRATYRLQLGTDLDFAAAKELLPYVADLGCSHLYLSPSFQAREGSTHGYDVIDPGRVSDALGGEEGLRALAAAAHELDMGLILDVVPNHMAADDANRYWSDPELRERFFDVDPVSGRWRRFFDIDELAGVRIEDPEVFEAMSGLAIRLVEEDVVDGLRIDHPDGLRNPLEYLRRLRERGVEQVWVEKILDPGEPLRGDWPVSGTVGYEFANDVAALFVDRRAEETLTDLYVSLTGDPRPFGALADEAKLQQATTSFTPEVERLARLWPEVADALPGALSALPVYRTYVEPDTARVEGADREALVDVPDRVRRALTLDDPSVPAEFVWRFQQTTPAVMAKGVEDTAFYRYVRLLALNEVGGDPSRFGIDVDAFHQGNARRLPFNLLVSSTHDTKRSGDVRARLCALTWMAEEWAGAVRSWFEVNAQLRDARLGAPTPAEEYLVYQTLIGAWPIEADRLEPYLEKALREAKVSSSWIDPDVEHEAAAKAFAVDLLDHGPFRYGFDVIASRVADLGARVALAQTLLKLTVPGLPDVYQGDELWAYSLVDPDNRRPVDWAARREALAALRDGAPPTAETVKLHLVAAALELRRRRPEAFAASTYTPVPAGDDVLAFLRGDAVLVAVTIRDGATGAGGWELPASAAGRWRDVLGGEEYELPDGATLGGILGPTGRALLERVA